MKTRWLAMAALPLLAAPGFTGDKKSGDEAKESTAASRGRLARVADGRKIDERFDRDAWRKRLSASDLADREQACEELGDLARRDGEAREALVEWSKDEHDRDLAWTSRMLLREVNRDLLPPLRSWNHRGGHGGQDWLGTGFDFDDFSRRFHDLDSLFGDLRAEWSQILGTLPAPSSSSSTSSSKSMTLKVEPDEVTCTVTENVDGKEETRSYTAKSMDELLEAHPELREHLGGTQFRFFPGMSQGRWRVQHPDAFAIPAPRAGALEPRGLKVDGGPPQDRLGIYCGDLDQERASELGLEAGVGLSVVEVQPGTIAGLLGLRPGDVVIEVDGRTVHGTEDVRRALKDRSPEAAVSVLVAGENGERRTLTWKPKIGQKTGSRDL